MNSIAYPRDSWERATEEGTKAYEEAQEFASCPYEKRTVERMAWEAAWRIADFKRKEILPA